MKSVKSFYKSKKWKIKRQNILLRLDNFLRQESKRLGKTIPAKVAHHIFPLEDYPELKFGSWNLRIVSNKVHNTFHDRMINN